MYNYQTFLREQTLHQHISVVRRQHHLAQAKRQRSSPALVHAHKKRVEGFILSAIDKPVPVTQYKNEPVCFRSTAPNSKGFYLRRETQSQRIQNQLKRNSQLDEVPFNNTFSHQFRETQGKGLRYKPFTNGFRLREYLDKMELNYLPNNSVRPDKTLLQQLGNKQMDLRSLNSTLNKSLLPVLHAKTYFKSVSTLFTEVPANQRSQVVAQEGVEQVDERRASNPKDHLSRKQNSRQALLKCNMLPRKLRS